MKTVYKSSTEARLEKRMAQRLKKYGYKLIARGGGFAILVSNDVVNTWIEADGMTPVPYSLSLHDVIRLTHEYVADAETAELEATA